MRERLPRGVRREALCRLCPRCDYDLSGLPDECTCPECGTAIERGLRSAKVWWLDGPSYLQFAIMSIGAMIFVPAWIGGGVSLAGRVQQPVQWIGVAIWTFVFGVFALGFVFGAIISFTKLRAKAAGETDATLHFSLRGIGLAHGGLLDWHPWSAVTRSRLRRTLTRRWVILIKGRRRWWLLGKRRTLIHAIAPFNRREMALLRNTMRSCRSAAAAHST